MRSSSKYIIKFKEHSLGETVNLEYFEEAAATKDDWQKPEEIIEEDTQQLAEDVEEYAEEKELVDLEKLGEETYQEAQLKAARLINAAEADAKKIKEEAYEKAYNEGLLKAQSEYEKKLEESVRVFASAVNELVLAKERAVKETEADIAKLLALSVEKITRLKIDKDDQLVMRLLNETLPLIAETEELVIEVNQDDYQTLEDNREAIVSLCPKVKNIRFIVSKEVEKGGCLIQSGLGKIDARLSVQIDNLIAKITSTNAGVTNE